MIIEIHNFFLDLSCFIEIRYFIFLFMVFIFFRWISFGESFLMTVFGSIYNV